MSLMKNKLSYLILALSLATLAIACAGKKRFAPPSVELNEGTPVTIKGRVLSIENGKDGYTATVLSDAKITYQVTISRINLERKKASYKRFEAGEKVTITGDWWKDNEGKIYIAASNLHL